MTLQGASLVWSDGSSVGGCHHDLSYCRHLAAMAPAVGEVSIASGVPPPAAGQELPIEGKTVKALTLLSLKRTFDLFAGNYGQKAAADEARCAGCACACAPSSVSKPFVCWLIVPQATTLSYALTDHIGAVVQPARKDCVQSPRRVPGGERL